MAQAAPSPIPSRIELQMPPVTTNEEGKTRSVGVEIEFVGPTAEAAARALMGRLGGLLSESDPHAFRVTGSAIGDFAVALDSRMAHPPRTDHPLGAVLPTVAAWFGTAARGIIPCELVTGPVPIDRLSEIDRLVAVLRDLGARGTQDGALYAFGLHFNPEIPRKDAETALAYLKAFVLLNAWLRKQVSPDRTRDLLGFADPFPPPYVRRIVAPDHWPDLPTFIDEYLAANPTRNRDLDLLPLLLHLDEARVRAALPGEKINGRPTFHYRLPDARVSDPGWSIVPDWNRWIAVERLACDRERLDAAGAARLAYEGEEKSWAEIAERIAGS